MSHPKRKRFAFRPAVTESRLEERLVLSTGAGGTVGDPSVYVLTPPTQLAPAGVTPARAAPPVSARAAALAMRPLTVGRLRKDYARQVHAATRDLRAAIRTDVNQLDAGGATPTAQQLADFNASIGGALNATALRLSTQAALLPTGGSRLVPAIQNALLGSGSRSLVSRLTALAQSGRLIRTSGAITPALTQLTSQSTRQGLSLINNYFNTTPVGRLSVNSSGQRIPLQQYLGGQLLNQVANTFGSLAQSFPTVASSMLFPEGVTGTPAQAALNAFSTQYNNAMGIAAYQLGSGLALFPGYSNVVTQLLPALYGTTGSSGSTGGGTIGGTSTFNGLIPALQNLQYGSPGFDTAVSGSFGSAYQNLVTPIAQYFGLTGSLNTALPTGGFTSTFGSPFTGSSYYNGFNNGFATTPNTGFIGFGMVPVGFNASFGTGFNNFITNFNQNIGFNSVGAGSGVNGISPGPIGAGSGVNGISPGPVGDGSGVNGIGSGNITGTGSGIV